MANKLIIDGETVFGSTSSASSILCTNTDGSQSNVQTELDNIQNDVNNNKTDIDSCLKTIELRYNEESDMVEIYYNNTWHPWKAGNLQTYEELIPMTGGSISVSSTYSTSYPVSNLLSDSGVWYSAKNDTTPWIIYDFSKDVLVNNIYLSASEIGSELTAATSFRVYFSTDDINYTGGELFSFTVAQGKGQFYFDNIKCSRIKIQFTQANDTAYSCCGAGRLKIRGKVA